MDNALPVIRLTTCSAWAKLANQRDFSQMHFMLDLGIIQTFSTSYLPGAQGPQERQANN